MTRFVAARTIYRQRAHGRGAVALFLVHYHAVHDSRRPQPRRDGRSTDARRHTIVLFQIVYLLQCRSLRHTVFRIGVWSNPWVWAGIGAILALQLGFIYLPPAHDVFRLHAAGRLRLAGGCSDGDDPRPRHRRRGSGAPPLCPARHRLTSRPAPVEPDREVEDGLLDAAIGTQHEMIVGGTSSSTCQCALSRAVSAAVASDSRDGSASRARARRCTSASAARHSTYRSWPATRPSPSRNAARAFGIAHGRVDHRASADRPRRRRVLTERTVGPQARLTGVCRFGGALRPVQPEASLAHHVGRDVGHATLLAQRGGERRFSCRRRTAHDQEQRPSGAPPQHRCLRQPFAGACQIATHQVDLRAHQRAIAPR